MSKRSNEYINRIPKSVQVRRLLWEVFQFVLFRPFPTKIFRTWRNSVLRLFGARIHRRAGVYASARIWAPWNLEMEDNAWIGPYVNCYNVDRITLERDVTISQGAYICTASHDIYSKSHDLITAPIIFSEKCWVATEAYIYMGVTIGEGAVVGARAAVFKNVEPWAIVGGNPAKFIKKREIKDV
ncbi:putative colanic acid biosynthesis acetyltransferase [Sphingobacterium siyangense]|uniref:putative colanic acid biosynthesis acetyltransferase n=1 Tax=Sphingobacterium siyangense TaxID=459529 RepID=UPI003DA277D2